MRLRKRTKTGAKKVQTSAVEHPIIYFSDWFKAIMASFPKIFLGGYDLHRDTEKYMDMFATFWMNFEPLQSAHPVYQKTPEERQWCVPIALHGDEGRGLAKVPLLVISFQVLIPFTGPENLSQTEPLEPKMFWDILVGLFWDIWDGVWDLNKCGLVDLKQLRHSFTTRLLYTLIPSTWYSGDSSVDGLLRAMASDLTKCFEEGIPVEVPCRSLYIYIIYI